MELPNYSQSLSPFRTGSADQFIYNLLSRRTRIFMCTRRTLNFLISRSKIRSSYLFYRVVAISQSLTFVQSRQMLMKFEYSECTSLQSIRNKIFFSPKPQTHLLKKVIIDNVYERKEQADYRELLATFENNCLKLLNI